MNKFKNKLYKFMYGRYGIDELYKIGLIVCLLLSFLNIFINSRVVTIVEFILLIILIIRSLSKNIIKRKYENSIYLNLKKKIKNLNYLKIGCVIEKLISIESAQYVLQCLGCL